MRREFKYQNGAAVHTVTVEPDGDRLTVRVGESVFSIVARPVDQGRLDLEVDGRRLRAYAVQSGNKYYVAVEGQTWTFQRPDERARRKSGAGAGTGSLQAAMPGRVLDVLVAEGDVVAKGDTLVLLEAMKMELRITAAG